MTAVLPKRETLIAPGSARWRELMTGSKVAAALGLHPTRSPRAIWHEMRGDVPPDPTEQIMEDGHHLEPAIAAMWLDRNPGAKLLRGEHTVAREDMPWAAANPDGLAELPDGRRVYVEWKTDRDGLQKYGDQGTDQVPVNYLIQCLWQMILGDCDETLLVVLGGRNLDLTPYRIQLDYAVGRTLIAKAYEFWDSLHLGTPLAELTPPALSEDVCEIPVLKKLHPDIDGDLEVELDHQLAYDHVQALAALKSAEKRADHTKARVLDAMGRARLAKFNTLTVARRQPSGRGGKSIALYPPNKTPLIPDPNQKENTTS